MSQLPPPNFGYFPPSFNVNGFPTWPALAQGTSPSVFGRPQAPPLAFPPRLPMNYFPCPPFSQFGPSTWPNMNHLPQHVLSQATQNSPSQHHRPQATHFQATTNKIEENGQNSSLKNEFSCDACEKEFASKENMNAHLGSHVQCSFEGCIFKASRKMLKLHWIQVHETGKMRINLVSPQEIAKWREDRKRKYPTLANVEKKKEDETKRKASGQILKTKNFRYRRGQRGGRTFQRGGHNHFNNRDSQSRIQEHQSDKGASKNHVQNSEKISEDRNCEGTSEDLKRLQNGGDPLSFVLGDSDENQESGIQTETETKDKSVASNSPSTTQMADASNVVPTQASGLGSLCSAYASDSEDDEEMAATEINNNKETDHAQDKKDAKKSTKEPETRQNMGSKSKAHRQTRGSRRCRQQKRKPNSQVNPKSMGVRKSTLLEKLLAPEVRHERNVILQCLRHIVKRNFFGVRDTTL